MGRYNLTPARVHQAASRLVELRKANADAGMLHTIPPWFQTIGSVPPGEILTRTQPVQHTVRKKRSKKPSKMFKPLQIKYEEDNLRNNFYSDHPWELARPRVILEQDGKDGQKCDWSKIQQPTRELNGERSVPSGPCIDRTIANILFKCHSTTIVATQE
jgi:small subunit ribosomal protein S23